MNIYHYSGEYKDGGHVMFTIDGLAELKNKIETQEDYHVLKTKILKEEKKHNNIKKFSITSLSLLSRP